MKFKRPCRASLLLQKRPYSRIESALHFPLTSQCSGSTRGITIESFCRVFLKTHMHTYAPYSLPASKCPGNSNSSSCQRCKVLKYVLIYGKYEACLDKYLTIYSKKSQNKHKNSCLRYLMRCTSRCAFPGFLQRCLSRILDVSPLLYRVITITIPPSTLLCISDLFSINSLKTKYT